jgi:hypothetical protein
MQIEAERAAESSLKSSKVICFTSFAEREFEDSVLAGADRNHRDQRKQLEQERDHQLSHLLSAKESPRRETWSATAPESTQEIATS